jgi:hypothetical protein
MMSDTSLRRPLLDPHPAAAAAEAEAEDEIHHQQGTAGGTSFSSAYARRRSQARALLSSRAKHYFVLALVALDVGAILADLFIALVACDLRGKPGGGEEEGGGDPEWAAQAREVLHALALAFSAAFVAELGVTVWAFGWRYVSSLARSCYVWEVGGCLAWLGYGIPTCVPTCMHAPLDLTQLTSLRGYTRMDA